MVPPDMLALVSYDADPLPDGWDEAIPESIWPDAMISAIRHDVGALASPRVLRTLRLWRSAAHGSHPIESAQARNLLIAVGEALLLSQGDFFDTDSSVSAYPLEPKSSEPKSEEHTVASFKVPTDRRPPPPPPDSRVGPPPRPASEDATQDKSADLTPPSHWRPDPGPEGPTHSLDPIAAISEILGHEDLEHALHRPPSSTEIKKPGINIDDLKPPEVTQFADGLLSAMVSSAFEDDERPTRSSPLSNADARAPQQARRSSVPPPLPSSRASAPPPALPSSRASAPPPPLPSSRASLPPAAEPTSSPRLAPKPGVVRRRSVGRSASRSRRPRASMLQVRPLYTAIDPLCRELIPLSYERRSRRFWAHWREVSGDRGVRREVIDDLLRSATDARTLIAELIGEVHAVNPSSVRKLMEKIDTEGRSNALPIPSPTPRGSIAGASVKVEAFSVDRDDD